MRALQHVTSGTYSAVSRDLQVVCQSVADRLLAKFEKLSPGGVQVTTKDVHPFWLLPRATGGKVGKPDI